MQNKNVIVTAYQFHHNDYLQHGETWLDYNQLDIADCALKLKAAQKAQDSADQLFAEQEEKHKGIEKFWSLVQKYFKG